MSIPVGSPTERTTYPGIFGFATIDMSFTLTCTENFYGPKCGKVCPENCICPMSSNSSLGTPICATTSLLTPSANENSTNQQNVIVIAISISIGGIVLLLSILFTISLTLFLHIRKKKVKNEDEYEMNITVAANSENDGVS